MAATGRLETSFKEKHMAEKNQATPLCDELEKGPYPSFITEIKKAAKLTDYAKGELGILERSYSDKIGHWKHGGIVGVMGYGGGVIGRYCDIPEEFPEVEHFHTMRINQPAGWFYTSEALRSLCDIWDRHGSGIMNMHGSTGDIVFLGTKTDELEPTFAELVDIGFDIGGSGSDLRTPSCCCGMARCEWACYDTMAICYDLTMHYQDELHRPAFPYKFKFKFAGCPNDCVAAIARADLSVIGTWKDDIQIDKDAVTEYAKAGLDIQNDVVALCPSSCIQWDGKEINIDNSECKRCMHCINVMPKALRPGKERGAALLLGSKAPIVQGAQLSSMLVPFVEIEPPYDDLKGLIDDIWDEWAENGKNRERVGEYIQRIGMGNFLERIGLEPTPEMIAYPRDNPYIFFESEDDEEEEE
jgi:sulfite reductase alpha subunit